MKNPRIFTLEEESYIVKSYSSRKRLDILRSELKTSAGSIKEILKKNGIEVSLRKQPLNIEYFKEINSPEKAYWLGFIAADGCLHKTKYKLGFCIKDPDILFKFQKAIGAGSPVGHRWVFDKRTEKKYEQYNLQINSKEFCQHIRSHGIDENKSKKLSFPQIEEKYYPHFIRGLYDGDGSIHIGKDNRYRVNMISTLECVTFMKEYFEKVLGWEIQKIYSKHDQGIHYLSTQKSAPQFLEWIYKDSGESNRLDRKYKKYMENKENFQKACDSNRRLILNEITGERCSTHNITQFCLERGFSAGAINNTCRRGRSSKKGAYAGWRLTPYADSYN